SISHIAQGIHSPLKRLEQRRDSCVDRLSHGCCDRSSRWALITTVRIKILIPRSSAGFLKGV
ncbi:MAG: hypothetical protein AAF808_23535, partial [Cyanobacteria bacterium P01_D01_bin.2]